MTPGEAAVRKASAICTPVKPSARLARPRAECRIGAVADRQAWQASGVRGEDSLRTAPIFRCQWIQARTPREFRCCCFTSRWPAGSAPHGCHMGAACYRFFTGTSSGISIWMETNRHSAVLVIRAPVTFPLKRGFSAMGTKLGEKRMISWPCFCCKPLPFFRQCKPYACRVASA